MTMKKRLNSIAQHRCFLMKMHAINFKDDLYDFRQKLTPNLLTARHKLQYRRAYRAY